MARLWSAWLGLLAKEEAATSLALFRAALGLCTLALIGTALYSGAAGVVWVDDAFGGYRDLGRGPPLVRLLGGPTPAVAFALTGVALVGGLLTFVGALGRLPPLLTLFAVDALAALNGQVSGGYDRLLTNGLFLIVLSGSTTTLSLDCWWRTGRFCSDKEVPAWPRYLAMLQLVVVYWMAGLNKIGAAWTPAEGFSALYYILQQPDWQRFDMGFLAWVYPLTQIGTALTWLWELSFPVVLLWLWARSKPRSSRLVSRFASLDVRLGYLGVGVVMHLATWALMEVGPFSWLTLAFYLCWFTPDEWRRRVDRAR